MEQPKTAIRFVDEADDTAENREIVEIVERRSGTSRKEDRDLDQLMSAVGLDPADFMPR